MKKLNYLFGMLILLVVAASCNKVKYKKTNSGLVYKLFPSKGKDSLIRVGDIAKMHMTYKLNDSVMFTSYGKAPAFAKVSTTEIPPYNFVEILPLMKKGDSAVTIQMIDTLLNRGERLPPNFKKGDRLITTMYVLEVFKSDSLAQADYNIEAEKDRPRQMKEQEEMMAKMEKEKKEAEAKEELELEKSGEIARELQEMEAYLAKNKITAQKVGKGTYVEIKQQGTGPQAMAGKYVNVKYNGKFLSTDSSFQSNSYAFQLGSGNAIQGWHEGLQVFRQGGKGTLYIPGFRAYGKNPPQGSPFKPFEPLKFDVELLQVSDSVISQGPQQ